MVREKHDRNPTRRRYDRIAFLYDFMELPMERALFARWRAQLLNRIVGTQALEVGVGTGKNLPYYPRQMKITAIDLSPRMLKRARRRASGLDLDIDLQEMDVQQLAFPDHVFDAAFATFVFCSVLDPVRGLQELRRVCKNGGKLFLLEHMRPGNLLLGMLFDLLNPFVVRMTGANINRRTTDNIRKAGWRDCHQKRIFSDIVWWIEAEA